MITINGSQVSAIDIVSRYSNTGTESACAKILAQSQSRYDYSDYGSLDFELALRREILNSASKLLRSGLNFEVFRSSYCNTQYWYRTSDGGFDLRRGVPPSAAVRDIFNHGQSYGTECATAMQIVYLGALLSLSGDTKFDSAIGGISLMNWTKLTRALAETGSMQSYPDYLPADRRYFANPDVSLMTPEWQGENVIDMGDGTYYGHGVGRLSAGEIISDLNQNRRPGSSRSAYLMLSAGRPDFEKLHSMFG